jgi:hypothetical protein
MENNNSTANHFLDEKKNGGLCDETLNIFRQFIAMATVTSMHWGGLRMFNLPQHYF